MLRVLLTFLLAVLIGSAAFAEGKITEDPNAPGAAPPAVEEEQPTDARLAQKITYEAKKKMVVEILDDLAKLTGITFKAGSSKSDWQVRDRRMNVFAKDVPLARLMSSLARVMSFKWSKSDDKEAPSYRLFADFRTLREAEAKLEQENKAREQRLADKRKRALEALGKSANMSPEELAKLKQEDPLTYFFASHGLSGAMASLMNASPSVADALANGQHATLSAANLPPAAQQAVLAMMTSMNRLEKQLSGGQARDLPGNLADNLGKFTIDINRNLERASGSPEAGFMLGDINFRYSEGEGGESYSNNVPLFDSDSALAKVLGKMLVRSEETGRPMSEAGKEIQSELASALVEDTKKDMPGEPKPEQPLDPDLEKKVKMDASGGPFEDVLGKLSEASEFAVVSDSFGRTGGFRGEMVPSVMVNEGDLKTVLDKLGDAYLYGWEKHGPVIEFRDRDWLRKRAALIPEAWLEYWRTKYKTDKTLDIKELAKMAALTTEQLRMNIAQDEVLQNCYFTVVQSRDMLKLYAVLSDAQRQLIFTEPGLNLRGLGPDQWPAAENAIQSKSAALLDGSDTPLVLTGQRISADTSAHYELSIKADSAVQAKWNVNLPQYQEHKKPEQTDKKSEQPAATVPKQTDKPAK